MRKHSKVDTKTEPTDKLKSANQKLKAENRNLRKQLKFLKRDISRLQKQMNISEDFSEVKSFEEELLVGASFEDIQVEVPTENLTCIQCGSHNVESVTAGVFRIEICLECGKKRKKSTM